MVKDLVAVGNMGVALRKRALTPTQYGDLADVPPELEWLANITNPKTRRAYKIDVSEFSAFAGLTVRSSAGPRRPAKAENSLTSIL